jgi:hypothetical protein
MTSPNGDGAVPNAAMPPTSVIQATFDPAAVATFWMSSSARLMRSAEIFMRGMTEIGRLEAAFGQQYLQRGMTALHTPALGTKPDELTRSQIDQTMHDVETLITTMRKIADELRHTINDSTQALFDISSPGPEPCLSAAIHIDDPVVKRKPTPVPAVARSEAG